MKVCIYKFLLIDGVWVISWLVDWLLCVELILFWFSNVEKGIYGGFFVDEYCFDMDYWKCIIEKLYL